MLGRSIKRTEEIANFVNSVSINVNNVIVPQLKIIEDEFTYIQFAIDFLLNKIAVISNSIPADMQVELINAFQDEIIARNTKQEDKTWQPPSNKSDVN